MVQRRTPGGQGPSRRPGLAVRATGNSRGNAGLRSAGRSRAAGGPRAAGASRTRAEPPRSAARPAAVRRPAATGSVKRTTAPQPRRLTGRAAVLSALLLALLLAYAYPIRVYLSQQAEIARLQQAHAAQREHIGDLVVERANWDDPEFVKAQARKRFQLVEHGDKTYIVFFDAAGAAGAAGADPVRPDSNAEPPWYARLWSSIDAANKPPETEAGRR